ncbi:MRG-domain-containing protein [Suhomyces tanzawaensis NRRL Y-17324]|uniref:Chromatin modification-related protein EAF3 n=1 Tax=Suhomyces tanzawaensis NRRL Y-17324 TaxID=984487 RepID=A0A1E4SNU9_9ASCO|nr:MRG-domain-containing protein [Suhomyces tanzawaensis NRRL Y-17324]ODV81158.1 MRG-domain-containing protein [Suhomyces tanzawaensis NRRL Y-17324]
MTTIANSTETEVPRLPSSSVQDEKITENLPCVFFEVNSTVLAFHGPLIYEAKVLKTHKANEDWIINAEGKHESFGDNPKFNVDDFLDKDSFFLHYQGWKSKWDEWVTTERVLENNEDNRYKKTELEQLTKRKRKKPSTPSLDGKKRDSLDKLDKGPPSKKAKLTGGKSSDPTPNIQLEFNNQLKYILVDDWEFITKDKKIIDLPSKYPISKILTDYYEFRKAKLATKDQLDILDEIIQGLELYFNKSLSLMLLYKYENLQYLNLIKNGQVSSEKKQSEVYGIEHLLRLLISFPGLLSQTTMDGVSISVLVNELTELLKFLTKNIPEYVNQYVNASPQYDSLARA